MYVWNGFTVVGKRPELTESILIILEEAEQQLRQNPGAFFFFFFFLNRWPIYLLFLALTWNLTTLNLISRPVRVSHRWPVCHPAAERPVSKTAGPSGPGGALLQSRPFQVSSYHHHRNTYTALERESTAQIQSNHCSSFDLAKDIGFEFLVFFINQFNGKYQTWIKYL